MGVGVDVCVCFHNIYSYIVTVTAVEQWYFHLPHYIEYHASKRPIEQDNLPVLIRYTNMGRPFILLSIDYVTSHWKPHLPILTSS